MRNVSLSASAREHDMIIEGPNCLGMVNYVDGIPLTFVVTPPQAQSNSPGVAILSQSGALAAVIAVNMRHHGISLTYSVSTGNEASHGIEDFLEHLIGDANTRVLALVVEQFRKPNDFLNWRVGLESRVSSSSSSIPAAAMPREYLLQHTPALWRATTR